MRKILILMIGLLFAMPMFAQKVNSRGEKMVKSITDVRVHLHDGTVYTFNYDTDGNMVSAKVVKGQHEGDPKFWLIEKEDNILTLTTNQKHFSRPTYICYTNPIIHKITLETNSNGLIKQVIVPRFGNFDKSEMEHIDYTYSETDDGHYVLVADTISCWNHEEGKKPILIKNENPTYKGCLYSYNSGKYQYKYYSYYQGETHMLGFPDFSYDGIKNDTNIPLVGLFDEVVEEVGMLKKLLCLTEWNPIYSPLLPSENKAITKTINEYKYFYEDGNIVRIESYEFQTDKGKFLFTNEYIIEYVEE